MMRKILPLIMVGILVLSGIGVGAVSSDTLRYSQLPDEVESELQNEELDSFLSSYGLETGDTMGEFEQLLYNLASKRRWMNPSLAAELINDVDELSDKLEQIGVTDDMTITEALPIIENNKEQLQEEGINLFCSIDMYAIDGGCWPFYRFYKALYGEWGIGLCCSDDHVTIKGLTGLQHCEGRECNDNYEGRFIGLIGSNYPVMCYFFESASQITWVRGDFVLFSYSNLPFVESSDNSQQSQCPCNQQKATTDNHPPNTPSNYYPCGELSVDVDVNLSWDGGDPDPGDSVTYDVYLGIDYPPLPIATVGPYPWNQTRIEYGPVTLEYCSVYYMKIDAWDNHGAFTQGYVCSFVTNCPPSAPTIDGPIDLELGTSYDFMFNAVDPEGHDVRFHIDWGDGNTDTTFYVPSGTDATVSHAWSEVGTYWIIAKAEDEHGAIGPESTFGRIIVGSPVIVAHVTEIYGTLDNPQYRWLADVNVKIREGLFWLNLVWSGTTDENGTTERVKVESGFLYKVIVSKNNYHTYGCLPYTIVDTYVTQVYHVNFTMAEDGSPFNQQISQSSQQQSSGSQQPSFIPNSQSVIFDDNTPPVSTHILDPPEPDGLNGWYVSDVTVILIANDDMSGVKEIRYHVNGIPGTIQGDHGTFKLTEDGQQILVEYWAIDNAGNEEAHHLFSIDMDQTKPEMYSRWEAIKKGGKWYISFIAKCSDATSSMNRVEFYVNTKLKEIVTGPGPIYNWTTELDIGYKVSGLICNREITEEKVSFFAIVVETIYDLYPLPDLDIIMTQAYDDAGNWDYNILPGGCPPLPERYYFTRFTFQNDYDGYIGRFFIHATFEVEL